VIDTPMDFSMICKEIEQGHKYMNSKDVYRDIQLIWHNCYKYNNKGDYIIDLMRRVKKNLSKYWGAAGLTGTFTNDFLSPLLILFLYCNSLK
jgi:Bromodomain